jgi:hypothetical protein
VYAPAYSRVAIVGGLMGEGMSVRQWDGENSDKNSRKRRSAIGRAVPLEKFQAMTEGLVTGCSLSRSLDTRSLVTMGACLRKRGHENICLVCVRQELTQVGTSPNGDRCLPGKLRIHPRLSAKACTNTQPSRAGRARLQRRADGDGASASPCLNLQGTYPSPQAS